MLIIGGLIAVAVVALLLAFFLARGAGTGQSAPAQPARAQEERVTPAASAPTVELPRAESPSRPLASVPASGQGLPIGPQRAEPARPANSVSLPGYYDEDVSVAALNRQVYELAGQLRSLQRQSQEIEQSLVELSGVLENLDARNRPQPAYYPAATYSPHEAREE
ncbi:hypothetical protein KDW_18630 [Dictyobacter vulcani]|uniref:Uncharacterized protein n=1 Tax=Dictyobacter vulcani TaxID=2607529 RepID=A0A5J4KN05_9CHLR|nr:hypothetical protein [Dictyobacter vulcani]GER87701.1 hypothetical protein KDW_18630 [Dictyobacter vulcani]